MGSWSNFRNATRYFWILKPKNISFLLKFVLNKTMYTRTDFNTTGSPQVHTSTIFTVALSGWNNTEVEIVFSWHTIERTNKQHPTESCKMETKLSITKKNLRKKETMIEQITWKKAIWNKKKSKNSLHLNKKHPKNSELMFKH